MFKKISQNVVKSPITFYVILQILVHRKHACMMKVLYKWWKAWLLDLMDFILEPLKNLQQNLVQHICSNNLLIWVKSPRNGLWLTSVHFIKGDRDLPSNYRPVLDAFLARCLVSGPSNYPKPPQTSINILKQYRSIYTYILYVYT